MNQYKYILFVVFLILDSMFFVLRYHNVKYLHNKLIKYQKVYVSGSYMSMTVKQPPSIL